jgi:hypothetical protein
MNNKHLPIIIGLAAVVLILIAGTLFFSGDEEGAGGAALAAAGAAEMARRRRADSLKDLDDITDEATEDNVDLTEVLGEAEKEMKANEEKVKDTSLADLADEENERTS